MADTITMAELANHYKVSRPTMHRAIKDAGIVPVELRARAFLYPKRDTIRELNKLFHRCSTCGHVSRSHPDQEVGA